MIKFSKLWPALAVTACSTPCTPTMQTVKVNVPTPVACIDGDMVPAAPAAIGALPDDARNAADLLASKLIETNGYAAQLRALVGACVR